MQVSEKNHYVINGKVNGRKALIVVDTGAPVLTLDPSLAAGMQRAEGLPRKWTGLYGGVAKASGMAALIEKLEVGPISCQQEPAVLLNLHDKQIFTGSLIPLPGYGRNYDVLIGWEFLSRHHAIIDAMDLKLFLRDTDPETGAADQFGRSLLAGGFKLIPLTARIPQIEISGMINDRPVLFLLDTASIVTELDVNQLNSLGVTGREKLMEIGDIGGKQTALSSTRIQMLRFGDFSLEKMLVGVADLGTFNASRIKDEMPVVHGILGPDILKRGRGIIDCANLRLYLHPEK
jgi:predicted aspartyl protease